MFRRWMFGSLMDAAGDGGGGGAAVADAASDFGGDTSDTPTEAGGDDGQVHDAEFVDPGTEGAPAGQEPSQALVKAGERAVQNGKFTPSGRAAIEALRPLSPALAQEVTQALLVRDWFRKEFPQGKKEIAALRQLAEQHGGEQGLSDLRSTASFFNELDELFSASNPLFLDKITTTPEEQRAFAKLMGPTMEKFEKLDGKLFGYELSKRFAHLMDTARLPVTFSRMADLLNMSAEYTKSGNNELAASLLGQITKSYNEIAEILDKVYIAAKNPPAPQESASPQLDDRARQLTQREQALQKQEWNTSVSNERRRLFSKSWAELTKGRNLNSDQESNVKGFYELRMSAKIKQWQNQSERFFSNGDRDGYIKEQYAFFQKAIPDALRQALQQAAPGKPGPKTPPAPGARTSVSRGTENRGNGGKVPIRVAKMPPTSDLDAVRTTGDMLSNNQAVRKDGQLVTWA
jgi:hypothetical protein